MNGYLLDTNILSDLVRNPTGRVFSRLAEHSAYSPCTSVFVAAELRYGAALKRSARLWAVVEGILTRLTVIPFEPPADRTYAGLRAELEKRGAPVRAIDLFIAAHALSLGRILVTDDRVFERVPGLSVENWLR